MAADLADIEPVTPADWAPRSTSTPRRAAGRNWLHNRSIWSDGGRVRGARRHPDLFPPTAEHPVRVEFWGR